MGIKFRRCNYILIFIVLLYQFHWTYSKCDKYENCAYCIQDFKCSWCSEIKHGPPGCWNKEEIHGNCTENYIVNPQSKLEIQGNEPLQTKDLNKEVVQISPQQIKLSLRQGEARNVTFRVSRAKNPLDLYFLIDLSATLRSQRAELSILAEKLPEAIKEITRECRIGFGSFIDKVELPFTNTVPDKLQNPGNGYVPTYSFKNHLRLFNHESKVVLQALTDAKFAENIDSLEGGFDALMQVLACDEIIGWKSDATRLILFVTDAGFHIAGDGKLAGIIDPNDGECHLENNTYTYGTKQDYPSVGQINAKVINKSVYIIFAVNQTQKNIYNELSKLIRGSMVEILKTDKILHITEKAYRNILSSVKMFGQNPNYLDVKFYTDCNTGIEKNTNECQNLGLEYELEFKVEITLKKCPKTEDIPRVTIGPHGINEKLNIEIESLCDCPCNVKGNDGFEEDSSQCSHSGNLQCGLCVCNQDKIGTQCECPASTFEESKSTKECKKNNEDEICSGRGTCKCSVCECNKPRPPEVYSGKYCEYSNMDCIKVDDKICAGNGECLYKKCECIDGFEGEDCSCKISDEECRNEENILCSDHGKCVCGKCNCSATQYKGQYCEVCPSCTQDVCQILKKCAECEIFKEGDKDFCKKNCINVNFADKQSFDYAVVKECEVYDDAECLIKFEYHTEDGKTIVNMKAEKICPSPITTALLSGVIAATVVLGILIIGLFKFYLYYKERNEYKLWKLESEQSKFSNEHNPLYKNPTTEFKNPLFGTTSD